MTRKERKKRRVLPWVLAVIFILAGTVSAFAYKIYSDLNNTANNIHEDLDRNKSNKRDSAVDVKNLHPFSVLILGVDERKDDKGRSDTMVVVTVNPKEKSTKMMSIPRDTYTEMVGKGFKDKANHAYAYGGIKMAMDTVENLFDIPIDYVVQVNMESFKDIVDAVGGIDIDNDFAFNFRGQQFDKGMVHLNGEEALGYVRMRYEDPRGDFGRQDRQKKVLQAVLKKGASLSGILNYSDIFKAIEKNIRTNLTFDEMMDIQSNYRDAIGDIEQLYIDEGEGHISDNGVWYYHMNNKELQDITNTLRKHLNLAPSTRDLEVDEESLLPNDYTNTPSNTQDNSYDSEVEQYNTETQYVPSANEQTTTPSVKPQPSTNQHSQNNHGGNSGGQHNVTPPVDNTPPPVVEETPATPPVTPTPEAPETDADNGEE